MGGIWKGVLAAALGLFGLAGAFAQGLEFSGLLDSGLSLKAGAGGEAAFSWGWEEYANLRMSARLREGAAFYGALNLAALSGMAAENAAALGAFNPLARPGTAPSALTAGENYAAALELERLYLRLDGETLSLNLGLTRLAFGYGQVWGPADFLNPRSPLFPDARPRAVLAAALAAYPGEDSKLLLFGAAPRDPFQSGGGGLVAGLSGDRHGDWISLQGLYAFETPREGSPFGIHRLGFSGKIDTEPAVTADLLYTGEYEKSAGPAGLSASLGLDYSFFEGTCYVLAEYLYSGAESVSARSRGGALSHRHYLYLLLRYRFDDYLAAALSSIAGLEDRSLSPSLSLEYEPRQGMALSLSGQFPLDKSLFSGEGKTGELGPVQTGTRFLFNCRLRLRF
jgi:hypothetical protein